MASRPKNRLTERATLAAAGVARVHFELAEAKRYVFALVDPSGRLTVPVAEDADEHTVFRIASMTKSFSAALTLLLRDEGVFALDDPIAKWEPLFASIVGPGADPSPITIRHLLTMGSGLATDDPWADRHLDATDAQLDMWVRGGFRFAYPTGTAFEYSNLGFGLLGRVIHRATGRRLQDLVVERLLDPLEMTRTRWSIATLPKTSDIAHGWHVVGNRQIKEPPLGDGVIAPMGGLWSTASDLCTWTRFLSSAFRDRPVSGPLRASSRREMQQVHRSVPIRKREAADGSTQAPVGGYGMGLQVFHDDAVGSVITHSGGLPGYGSNMRWTATGIGAVALANVTYAPMWTLTASVFDALEANGAFASSWEPHEELVQAVDAIAALARSWNDRAAARVFADNVALDVSLDRRRTEFESKATTKRPDVRVVAVEPSSASAGTATVFIDGAIHRVQIQLAPSKELRIQTCTWL